MSKEREALKAALEAFKQIDEAMPFPVAKLAQKAIREALAQPEQEITDSEMFKIRSAYRKGFEHGMEQAPQRKPLAEQFIMDATREMSRDFRWPSTMIDVWRLCEAAHGIKE